MEFMKDLLKKAKIEDGKTYTGEEIRIMFEGATKRVIEKPFDDEEKSKEIDEKTKFVVLTSSLLIFARLNEEFFENK